MHVKSSVHWLHTDNTITQIHVVPPSARCSQTARCVWTWHCVLRVRQLQQRLRSGLCPVLEHSSSCRGRHVPGGVTSLPSWCSAKMAPPRLIATPRVFREKWGGVNSEQRRGWVGGGESLPDEGHQINTFSPPPPPPSLSPCSMLSQSGGRLDPPPSPQVVFGCSQLFLFVFCCFAVYPPNSS